MKAKLLLIVLVISLGFNVFFLLGSLQARRQMEQTKTFRGRIDAIAHQLQLDSEQAKAFRPLRDEFEHVLVQLTKKREAFFNELIKDQPDHKILEEFRTGDSVKQLRSELLDQVQEFVRILRPDQRQVLVKLVEKRSGSSK